MLRRHTSREHACPPHGAALGSRVGVPGTRFDGQPHALQSRAMSFMRIYPTVIPRSKMKKAHNEYIDEYTVFNKKPRREDSSFLTHLPAHKRKRKLQELRNRRANDPFALVDQKATAAKQQKKIYREDLSAAERLALQYAKNKRTGAAKPIPGWEAAVDEEDVVMSLLRSRRLKELQGDDTMASVDGLESVLARKRARDRNMVNRPSRHRSQRSEDALSESEDDSDGEDQGDRSHHPHKRGRKDSAPGKRHTSPQVRSGGAVVDAQDPGVPQGLTQSTTTLGKLPASPNTGTSAKSLVARANELLVSPEPAVPSYQKVSYEQFLQRSIVRTQNEVKTYIPHPKNTPTTGDKPQVVGLYPSPPEKAMLEEYLASTPLETSLYTMQKNRGGSVKLLRDGMYLDPKNEDVVDANVQKAKALSPSLQKDLDATEHKEDRLELYQNTSSYQPQVVQVRRDGLEPRTVFESFIDRTLTMRRNGFPPDPNSRFDRFVQRYASIEKLDASRDRVLQEIHALKDELNKPDHEIQAEKELIKHETKLLSIALDEERHYIKMEAQAKYHLEMYGRLGKDRYLEWVKEQHENKDVSPLQRLNVFAKVKKLWDQIEDEKRKERGITKPVKPIHPSQLASGAHDPATTRASNDDPDTDTDGDWTDSGPHHHPNDPPSHTSQKHIIYPEVPEEFKDIIDYYKMLDKQRLHPSQVRSKRMGVLKQLLGAVPADSREYQQSRKLNPDQKLAQPKLHADPEPTKSPMDSPIDLYLANHQAIEPVEQPEPAPTKKNLEDLIQHIGYTIPPTHTSPPSRDNSNTDTADANSHANVGDPQHRLPLSVSTVPPDSAVQSIPSPEESYYERQYREQKEAFDRRQEELRKEREAQRLLGTTDINAVLQNEGKKADSIYDIRQRIRPNNPLDELFDFHKSQHLRQTETQLDSIEQFMLALKQDEHNLINKLSNYGIDVDSIDFDTGLTPLEKEVKEIEQSLAQYAVASVLRVKQIEDNAKQAKYEQLKKQAAALEFRLHDGNLLDGSGPTTMGDKDGENEKDPNAIVIDIYGQDFQERDDTKQHTSEHFHVVKMDGSPAEHTQAHLQRMEQERLQKEEYDRFVKKQQQHEQRKQEYGLFVDSSSAADSRDDEFFTKLTAGDGVSPKQQQSGGLSSPPPRTKTPLPSSQAPSSPPGNDEDDGISFLWKSKHQPIEDPSPTQGTDSNAADPSTRRSLDGLIQPAVLYQDLLSASTMNALSPEQRQLVDVDRAIASSGKLQSHNDYISTLFDDDYNKRAYNTRDAEKSQIGTAMTGSSPGRAKTGMDILPTEGDVPLVQLKLLEHELQEQETRLFSQTRQAEETVRQQNQNQSSLHNHPHSEFYTSLDEFEQEPTHNSRQRSQSYDTQPSLTVDAILDALVHDEARFRQVRRIADDIDYDQYRDTSDEDTSANELWIRSVKKTTSTILPAHPTPEQLRGEDREDILPFSLDSSPANSMSHRIKHELEERDIFLDIDQVAPPTDPNMEPTVNPMTRGAATGQPKGNASSQRPQRGTIDYRQARLLREINREKHKETQIMEHAERIANTTKILQRTREQQQEYKKDPYNLSKKRELSQEEQMLMLSTSFIPVLTAEPLLAYPTVTKAKVLRKDPFHKDTLFLTPKELRRQRQELKKTRRETRRLEMQQLGLEYTESEDDESIQSDYDTEDENEHRERLARKAQLRKQYIQRRRELESEYDKSMLSELFDLSPSDFEDETAELQFIEPEKDLNIDALRMELSPLERRRKVLGDLQLQLLRRDNPAFDAHYRAFETSKFQVDLAISNFEDNANVEYDRDALIYVARERLLQTEHVKRQLYEKEKKQEIIYGHSPLTELRTQLRVEEQRRQEHFQIQEKQRVREQLLDYVQREGIMSKFDALKRLTAGSTHESTEASSSADSQTRVQADPSVGSEDVTGGKASQQLSPATSSTPATSSYPKIITMSEHDASHDVGTISSDTTTAGAPRVVPEPASDDTIAVTGLSPKATQSKKAEQFYSQDEAVDSHEHMTTDQIAGVAHSSVFVKVDTFSRAETEEEAQLKQQQQLQRQLFLEKRRKMHQDRQRLKLIQRGEAVDDSGSEVSDYDDLMNLRAAPRSTDRVQTPRPARKKAPVLPLEPSKPPLPSSSAATSAQTNSSGKDSEKPPSGSQTKPLSKLELKLQQKLQQKMKQGSNQAADQDKTAFSMSSPEQQTKQRLERIQADKIKMQQGGAVPLRTTGKTFRKVSQPTTTRPDGSSKDRPQSSSPSQPRSTSSTDHLQGNIAILPFAILSTIATSSHIATMTSSIVHRLQHWFQAPPPDVGGRQSTLRLSAKPTSPSPLLHSYPEGSVAMFQHRLWAQSHSKASTLSVQQNQQPPPTTFSPSYIASPRHPRFLPHSTIIARDPMYPRSKFTAVASTKGEADTNWRF